MATATIEHPTGSATTSTMSATGTQAVTINNDGMTLIDGATTEATSNRTIDLTINGELTTGARLLITNKTNGTETLTHGTNITAPVITGSAGKTTSQGFTYNGTAFLPDGAKIQID